MPGNETPWNTCCETPKSIEVATGLLAIDPDTKCEAMLIGSYPGIPVDKNGDVQIYNGSDASPIVLPQLRQKQYDDWPHIVIKEVDGTITALSAPDDGIKYRVVAENGEFRLENAATIGGGGSPVAIEDEGVPKTAGVTKINFVGSGVIASEPSPDEITVTIPGVAAGVDYFLHAIYDGGLETADSGDGDYLTKAAANWTAFKALLVTAQSIGKDIFFPGGNFPFSGFTNDGSESGAGFGDTIAINSPVKIFGSGVGITSWEAAIPEEHAVYFRLGTSGANFHLNDISAKINQPTLPDQNVIKSSGVPSSNPSVYDASLNDAALQYYINTDKSHVYRWDGVSAWALWKGVHRIFETGINADIGEETYITLHDFELDGVQLISSLGSKDSEEIRIYNGIIRDLTSTAIFCFMDNGTEDNPFDGSSGDLRRKHLMVHNVDIQSNRFSHHIYVHPQVVCQIHSSRFEGATNAAIQFQNGVGIDGGQSFITGCFFRDNLAHIIGPQADNGVRSRMQISDNMFRGRGVVTLRGSCSFKNNRVYSEQHSVVGFGGMNGPSDIDIEGNVFEFWDFGTSPADVYLSMDINSGSIDVDGGTIIVRNNTFRTKRGTASGTAINWVNAGSLDPISVSERVRYIIEGNNFDCIDVVNAGSGINLYSGNFEIRNNSFAGGLGANIAWIGIQSGSSGSLTVECNVFDGTVGTTEARRLAISIEDEWNISGYGNDFRGGSWVKNNTGAARGLGLRAGHGGEITAATTTYLDPSFNEFTISGSTEIENLFFGTSTDRAVPAAGLESANTVIALTTAPNNYKDVFSGIITLYSVDGVTISGVVGAPIVIGVGGIAIIASTRDGFVEV